MCEHVFSILCCHFQVWATVNYSCKNMSLSTHQNLNALMESFSSFKDTILQRHELLEGKMNKFEGNLETAKESQEEATEQALKQIKRDRPLQFQPKGHEEQYHFNADMQDHVHLGN